MLQCSDTMLYVVALLADPPATCNNWLCESVLSLSFERWSFFFITRQPREETDCCGVYA